MNKSNDVTIILLTRNAGNDFSRTLKKIFSQKKVNFDVLQIDSSSTDSTLSIAAEYKLKQIVIPKAEFNHGSTREMGIEQASGEIVVFLTQDAVPSSDDWLFNLVSPFKDKKVAGTFGRQLVTTSSNLYENYYYSKEFPDRNCSWTEKNYLNAGVLFSDVNSALRRDLYLKNRYKGNILVSEDIQWAQNIIKKGYEITYVSSASVFHSHNYPLNMLFKISFDIGAASVITETQAVTEVKGKRTFDRIVERSKYMLNSSSLYWLFFSLIIDFVRLFGFTLGKKYKAFPMYLIKKMSNYPQYWDHTC